MRHVVAGLNARPRNDYPGLNDPNKRSQLKAIPVVCDFITRYSTITILALEIPRLRIYHYFTETVFEHSPKGTYILVIATKHAPYVRIPRYAYGHTRIGNLVISESYML